MTPAESAELLAALGLARLITLPGDKRELAAMALLWSQMLDADMPKATGLTIVVELGRTAPRGEWITAGTINAEWRKRRDDANARARIRELDAATGVPKPDDLEFGFAEEASPRRNDDMTNPINHKCPFCGARPGNGCTTAPDGKPLTHRRFHPSRDDAAGRPERPMRLPGRDDEPQDNEPRDDEAGAA